MDSATLIARSRKWAGLSQRQLAKRAATSSAAISLYESGQRIPRVNTLRRIVAATGATLDMSVTAGGSAIDLEANATSLKAVLDLADHLPKRSTQNLTAPIFARLVG